MQPLNHQDKQLELEQVFMNIPTNPIANHSQIPIINTPQQPVKSQYQLVEANGMLFSHNNTYPSGSYQYTNQHTGTLPYSSYSTKPMDYSLSQQMYSTFIHPPTQPIQSASYQMPSDLNQAQQAVQQAHQHLLDENQQLQQALYQLHQAQEKVKQCQYQVHQAQQQVQTKQATADSIVNSMK